MACSRAVATRVSSRKDPMTVSFVRALAPLLLRTLALAATVLAPWSAAAQDFPARAIHIVVPYAAGGVVDALARVLAAPMQQSLHQPVVVENKPGASGVVGLVQCANAAPDGYTICLTVQDSLS